MKRHTREVEGGKKTLKGEGKKHTREGEKTHTHTHKGRGGREKTQRREEVKNTQEER